MKDLKNILGARIHPILLVFIFIAVFIALSNYLSGASYYFDPFTGVEFKYSNKYYITTGDKVININAVWRPKNTNYDYAAYKIIKYENEDNLALYDFQVNKFGFGTKINTLKSETIYIDNKPVKSYVPYPDQDFYAPLFGFIVLPNKKLVVQYSFNPIVDDVSPSAVIDFVKSIHTLY